MSIAQGMQTCHLASSRRTPAEMESWLLCLQVEVNGTVPAQQQGSPRVEWLARVSIVSLQTCTGAGSRHTRGVTLTADATYRPLAAAASLLSKCQQGQQHTQPAELFLMYGPFDHTSKTMVLSLIVVSATT